MQKTVDPLKGKYKSVTAVRAIRNYDPEFDAKEFVNILIGLLC